MRSLAVRVLSDFGVDGIEPQALGSRKARLALQLLAMAEGQAVPAGVLIDALWGTALPARPEDQVAVLMSRLRSVLGRDRIEHRDRGYLLHCDWLDATELAGLTAEIESRRQAGQVMGAVAAARVALSLPRGDGPQPLPGEWAQLRQVELDRLISRARLVAATALLEAGDWMGAADAAAAAQRDRYDEAALRILLRGAGPVRQRTAADGRRTRHRSPRPRRSRSTPRSCAASWRCRPGPPRPPRAAWSAIIDDAHLAGPALADWLRFIRREQAPLVVLAAVRPGEGEPLPATAFIHLGGLDRDAAAELVGLGRVDELYARSKGHPLFLTELARHAAGTELPASLVESVATRCDELGPAGVLLRTAAVVGPDLDVDLLAAVLGRPALTLLDDAEQAVAKQLLVEADGMFRFRHELVREALAVSATAGRAALLHRPAGRVLSRRPGTDPLTVAGHARLGGDLALAARALREVSAQAVERFDHAAAETLLDDARLSPDPDGWLARARVRTLRRRYAQALGDVERAASAGPAALEVGARASYFGRNFAQAAQYAEDGALAAADPATRARCLTAGGRTHHAAGHLVRAELLLGEAFALAEGADRVTAAGRLGVLRAHQSRAEEALTLLRPAARGQIGVEHTASTLHSLLFTGHAHALAGRPAQALAAFDRYTAEVERRQVPRFGGRAVNFARWVLRNLGPGPKRWTGTPRRSRWVSSRAPRRPPSRRGRTWPNRPWKPATWTARPPSWRKRRHCCAATWCLAGGSSSSSSS
jgi:tetratricopeptide (TPR) repeat protein